jgi:hypothetical protein
MNQPTSAELTALLQEHEPPCISLYQPTNRRGPNHQQDPVRFKNLLREAEATLRRQYPTREVRPLLEPFEALVDDGLFWAQRLDGLAVLGAAGTFRVYKLPVPVPEQVTVADSFHTKPLMRYLQSADRYQVLCLSQREASLYEGNRYALDEIELKGLPGPVPGENSEDLTAPITTDGSYGPGGPGPGHTEPGLTFGHGQTTDADAGRFLRLVDRAVLEHHSRPSGLPLILAALPQHQAEFHKLSHNPFLVGGGVEHDPTALSVDHLRQECWKQMEPRYRERLAKLVADFHEARSKQMGSDGLEQVAEALLLGRVGTLLVEADRQIPGTYDRTSGTIQRGDLAHAGADDLLDDLAESALLMGGQVVVVPSGQMPTDTGLAAIYRY